MGTLIKIFVVFWAIWIIWYLTGGPLRDDKTKPYVGYNSATGVVESVQGSAVK